MLVCVLHYRSKHVKCNYFEDQCFYEWSHTGNKLGILGHLLRKVAKMFNCYILKYFKCFQSESKSRDGLKISLLFMYCIILSIYRTSKKQAKLIYCKSGQWVCVGWGRTEIFTKQLLGTAHVLLSDLDTFTQALGSDNSCCAWPFRMDKSTNTFKTVWAVLKCEGQNFTILTKTIID